MKILVAGDTHGDTEHVDYLLDEAKDEEARLIFVVGDFGYWEHEASGIEYLDNIDQFAAERGIPIYFLDGNHDKTSLLMQQYGSLRDEDGFVIVRESVKYAPRGLRWKGWGSSFIALGGAYSTDKDWRLMKERRMANDRAELIMHFADRSMPELYEVALQQDFAGALWFPEEEMSDNDMDTILLADSSQVDIMLTHDKPRASSPRWNRKDMTECYPNQDRIQRAVRSLRPKLLIHGHLHYRYTDDIWCGDDMQMTRVIGLDCNPTASSYGKGSLSHITLDLPLKSDALPD